MIDGDDDSTTESGTRLRALPGGRAGAVAGVARDAGSARGAGDLRGAGGATGGLRGGLARDAAAAGECVVTRGAVRAGDRHEPWTLPVDAPMRAFADDAAAAGVDFELAARVTVECALVCDDLLVAGVDLASLDGAAAATRVQGELDAAACAYLRRLTQCRDFSRRTLAEVVTVGLPTRLSARLLRRDPAALLATGDVVRAVAWESAAVLAGRTMSEWAPLTALRIRP